VFSFFEKKMDGKKTQAGVVPRALEAIFEHIRQGVLNPKP
jgi:hypothetical protein